MNFIIQFFFTFLYQPLLNILVYFYNVLPGHDLGLAMIILTVAIRIILHPLSLKSLASQKALQELQPKIAKIQNDLKDNKEAQSKAMLELYKKEKINPFSGCFMVLLQMPFMITLYYVAINCLKPELLQEGLYRFVANPGAIQPTLFWIFNLQSTIVVAALAVLSGLLQFLQTRAAMASAKNKQDTMPKQGDLAKMMQQQMIYFFPLISVFLVWQLGGLVGVYWTVSSLFAVVEQQILNRRTKKAA